MMEKQAWFFVSYVSAFFSVYLMSIAYSILPEALDMPAPTAWNAYTYQVNATMANTATMISFLPIILVVLILAACVGLLSSGEAMKKGMEE
jgi:hypothetical protein